jgi:hypothetical protein
MHPLCTPSRYVAALYWSIMTLTSVGYGDISAANTRQRCVSIWVMIVGACLFGYGVSSIVAIIRCSASCDTSYTVLYTVLYTEVSSIVAIISDLYSTDAEFRTHMDNVNNYMASKKLPTALRAEVREYMHRENRIRRSAQVTEEEEEAIHAGAVHHTHHTLCSILCSILRKPSTQVSIWRCAKSYC